MIYTCHARNLFDSLGVHSSLDLLHMKIACMQSRCFYLSGGCCRTCGSVEHYQRDCPDLRKQKGEHNILMWLNPCISCPYRWEFLAPPAERQRSFSNAELSVIRLRRPSSTFHLKSLFLRNCLITFFLLWHGALIVRYQCTVKMWILLNHPKGQF